MLMGVLAKAASAIGSIIKDPIGFLGHLVSGIRQGLDNFVGNIMTHLQTGLMGWLTGAMGAMGLQLPEDIFSLQGIFSLVTQILGMTWDYIRLKAVKLFGEPMVAGMEETVEIFQIIANQGPMGLWEHVQDQFGDLKETVIEEIKGMLITQVIMAGVKWIIGLLNPASAFVKAAMAIYDIVMFFINQGSQVVELVSAITDAVVAIASGAVGGAAKLVENALAKSLPVVIGFLASLLGIGDLAKKVQGIVKKVRDRIDMAIDKVLQKAKSLFKGKKGKGKKEQDKRNKDEEGKITEADRKKHEQIATLIKKDLTEKPKKPQQSFEDFYKSKNQQAKKLETKYQPQLKQGIGLEIAVGSIDQEKEDGDLDFKVRIAPNTTELEFPATWESGDRIKEEFIQRLKQEYRDIVSQDPNSEGIPKYQDLENEIEILKEEEMKDAQKAKQHFEKIKKQVEVIREITKYRSKYKNLGHEISADRVVIYGTYDLTLTPKEGGESKHIKGKYNAVSSQTTRALEAEFNKEAEKNKEDDRMMPTQNQYMRFFKVNPGMVNKARAARLGSDAGDRFPNPTHDAETKLFEYVARQIINTIHGKPSSEEQREEQEINELSNQVQEDETRVPALRLKQELTFIRDRIRDINRSLEGSFGALQSLAQHLSLTITTVDATNYANVQATLKSRRIELEEIIKDKNKKNPQIGERLTNQNKTEIGKIFSKEIGNSLQRLEQLKQQEQDLAGRLGGVQQQLKESTDKEAPWLDEEREDVKALKRRTSEFQQRQEKKLQQVIDNWEISGKIVINDEQKPCDSCSGLLQQFVNKFKPSGGKIKIDVTRGVQYYYGKTEPR
jgi:hypothetical protein